MYIYILYIHMYIYIYTQQYHIQYIQVNDYHVVGTVSVACWLPMPNMDTHGSVKHGKWKSAMPCLMGKYGKITYKWWLVMEQSSRNAGVWEHHLEMVAPMISNHQKTEVFFRLSHGFFSTKYLEGLALLFWVHRCLMLVGWKQL